MILYYSATGNSRYVVQLMGNFLNEKVKEICNSDSCENIDGGNTLGFVFPVYSWGLPLPVVEFFSSLSKETVRNISKENRYVWAILTCGDDVALTPEMMTGLLSKKGIYVKGIWSVQMPNTYVALPGFDVDSKEVEQSKIDKVESRLRSIANLIEVQTERVDVVRGGFAWVKTKMIYPLFRKWGINTKRWRVSDECIGCGRCKEICVRKNIVMKNNHGSLKPVWGKDCCSCMGCYHVCPRHAISYGGVTKGKGQYKRFIS